MAARWYTASNFVSGAMFRVCVLSSGRGKQRGLHIAYSSLSAEESDRKVKFLPKRVLSVVVEDEFVPAVVAVLTRVNRTGNIGDGRIFVCPVEESIRIRTGERGEEAIYEHSRP